MKYVLGASPYFLPHQDCGKCRSTSPVGTTCVEGSSSRHCHTGICRQKLYCPTCGNLCFDQGFDAVYCGACQAHHRPQACFTTEADAVAAIWERKKP
jgi:hypothetical protein